MNEITAVAPWGFFALVSYVPEPLGSFLRALRASLPNEDYPQSHITILPPRPLSQAIEAASESALAVLERFSSFEVALADVQCFPSTNFVYLDIGEGYQSIVELHAALSSGTLASQEIHEFRPHVTLAGPVPDSDVTGVVGHASCSWRSFSESPRFHLAEIVALWLEPGEPPSNWRQLWCHRLTKPVPAIPDTALAAVSSQTW